MRIVLALRLDRKFITIVIFFLIQQSDFTVRTFTRTTSVFLLTLGLLAAPMSPVAADTAPTGVTRADGSVALWQFAGSPAGPFNDPGFADVPGGTPDRTAIGWLTATGVTVGRSDGTFGVDEPLSRAALASMLYRLAGAPDGPYAVTPFKDVNPAGTHSVSIGWLWDTGLTFGLTKDRFGPFRPASQSQLQALLQRFEAAPDVTISLPSAGPTPEAPLAAFRLAGNGVTIVCDNATVGDSGVVKGVTYTKRTREQITVSNAATTCTSGVTNMADLFERESTFNGDISHWDTSNVTNMSFMFADATTFNQKIGDWDTSKATDMRRMFGGAIAFDEPIGNWDTSKVTDMAFMFKAFEDFTQREPSVFNQPIGNWDTSKVTDMRGMFQGASLFNQDLSWVTSEVTDMRDMFEGAEAFNGNIGDWDTSSVINMWGMFNTAKQFNKNIGGWNTASVTDMQRMFQDAAAFNQDLSGWCVTLITVKPFSFDARTPDGFRAVNPNRQPVWGSCPP